MTLAFPAPATDPKPEPTPLHFTYQQFLDAMRQNGYPTLRNGDYVVVNEDMSVSAACALGQACINLDVGPDPTDEFFFGLLGVSVSDENDNTDKSPAEMADWLEDKLRNQGIILEEEMPLDLFPLEDYQFPVIGEGVNTEPEAVAS